MRKLVIVTMLVLLSVAGWDLTRTHAATGTVDSVLIYNHNLKTGDRVTVYLTHPEKDGTELPGIIAGYDGTNLEISGENNTYCMGPKGYSLDCRKVTWIVPTANVLYIQKIVSEELKPTTQP